MQALLDMESTLRTASEPTIPNSPLRLADASPAPQAAKESGTAHGRAAAGVPSTPADLRPVIPAPQGANVEGGLPSPTVEAAQPPNSPLPTIPELPEGLASKLAQVENAAINTNLAATPSPLKDKLKDAAPKATSSKPKTKLEYVPVPRAAKVLPDAATFLERLKNPQPPVPAPVQVAQAGEGGVGQSPEFEPHYYLTAPESTPAAPALIAANGLLLGGDHLGALLATLDVMEQYTNTPPVIDAQTQFNDIFNALQDQAEGGNAAPLNTVEAGLPQGNEALLSRYASVESRYALIEFFQHRMLQALEASDRETAGHYADQTLDLAHRAMQQNTAHPLQSDFMHYYRDTAIFMGGDYAEACRAYLKNAVSTGEPSIARWTARYLLARMEYLTYHNGAERVLQFGGMIDEFESSGVAAALADERVYDWLRAALEASIGEAYYVLGDFENASAHFNNTFNYRTGSEPKAASMYYLADIASRQNPYDPNEAIAGYQALLEKYPKDVFADQALLSMAGLYQINGDYAQALQLYQEVTERYGESPSAPVARQEIEYILANQQGTVEVVTAAKEVPAPESLAMHCGPQALQQWLLLNSIESTVEELAALAGTDESGTTMAGLVRAAEAKGLALGGVRASTPEELIAPFVALLDGNHFVLVREVGAEHMHIFDSGQPENALPRADFAARWKGEALVKAEDVDVARVLAPEAMAELRGGNGGSGGPPEKPKKPCNPPKCKQCHPTPPPPGDGPPPPCPGGGGMVGPPPGDSGCGGGPGKKVAGSVGSPQALSGFDAPGVTALINTFETSLELEESDLSLDTLGDWDLSFGRSYRSDQGFHRVETSSTVKWWENNIGAGWSHSYNLHLRTSGEATPNTVVYWDPSGTYRTYAFDSTSAGYDWYYRTATGNGDELGHVLKRDTTTKAFTLVLPGGAQIEFSAATTSGDFIARAEVLVDYKGNTTTLVYDNATVDVGRLIKVQSPAGDAQHLAFTYSGNLITLVELKKNSTVLNSVSFSYTSNELTTVTDHASKTVEYEYDTDGSEPDSRFITKITNKRGIETDLAWTFGLNSLSEYEAYKIQTDNADGLTTVYDRSLTTSVCTVSNFDGVTLLDKLVNTPVTGDPSLSRYIDYYIDATNYERWTYTYDADRNLTEVTAPGNVAYSEFTYNAVGRVLTQQFGTGPIVEYQYDTEGQRVVKIIDTAGIETDYDFDVNGHLEKKTHPAVHTDGYQYEYDAYGNMTKEISPLGMETTYAYDSLGRVEEIIQDPGGLAITTLYEHDDFGNMVEMTDPRGEVTTYEYGDPSCGGCGGGGHLEKVTDALTRETEWIYNADGLLETSIDASGIETDYAYDDMGRLETITHPAGSAITSTIVYNKLGQVASRTDFGGNTTSYAYDHMGRTTTVTDAVGDIDYAYNSLGQLVTVTDSLGHDTTNTYDTALHLTEVVDEIGKETHYGYDAAGRQETVGAGTSGTVDITTYAYSATTGLLESVEYGTSTYTANYEYDGEARLVKLTDWIDAVDGLRYGYDAVGRLETITDYDDSVLTYTYDDGGNVLSMVDYHGNTTSYTYNDIGQLDTLTAPGSKVWDYTYDSGNRLSRVDIPNGMHTEYTYDASGRQDSIHHKDGSTVKQGFDYTFDDGGNITRIDHEDGSYWAYDYDGRERLIEALRGNHASPTILATYEYTYDDADNMLTKEVPWYDDFEDGNITGWSGNTTYYSVTGGVLKNTSDTTVRDLYLSETDADHDLSFDYVRYSSTGRVDVYLRTIDGNNRLYLEINPGDIKLRQVDGGTLSTLATYTTTVAEDAWYKLRAILDGTSVKIYWGADGADFNEIISATTTKTTTVRAAYFRAQANSEHGFDNIQLIAGTRSTTETFTYNDANEQLTHAKNGVTTTMTYDDWGRLATRDDGTHDATYAYRYGSKLYSVSSDFPGEGNVVYETGGDGKRRSRVVGGNQTWYNWSSRLTILSEENDADGTGPLNRSYIGRNTAHVEGASPSTGDWRYYTLDALKSSRSVWNAYKSRHAALEYTAFGEFFSATEHTSDIQHTYGGHDSDPVSGLHFRPFRYYSPVSGRWTSRDPIGVEDGPNLYTYVHANPIMYTDPLGLFTITNPKKCCGKEKDIENAANAGCSDLVKWYTDPDLRACVEKRCKNGKIKCRKRCPSDTLGWSLPFGRTAGICVKEQDNNLENTVMHEWLHTCGYHLQDPPREGEPPTDLPPWGDGV